MTILMFFLCFYYHSVQLLTVFISANHADTEYTSVSSLTLYGTLQQIKATIQACIVDDIHALFTYLPLLLISQELPWVS